MSSRDHLAQLDHLLVRQGVLDAAFIDEYDLVHESVALFRQRAGALFSLDTLKEGESHLRSWLTELHDRGESKARLLNYLKCGLGHLCLDFIEFTYESLAGQELIDRAFSSFSRRGFHHASLAAPTPPPPSGGARKKNSTRSARTRKPREKKI